jgi:hypothetical protein
MDENDITTQLDQKSITLWMILACPRGCWIVAKPSLCESIYRVSQIPEDLIPVYPLGSLIPGWDCLYRDSIEHPVSNIAKY